MSAASVFRALLVVRACWLIRVWFVDLFPAQHWTRPYEPALSVLLSALLLIVLIALWFFRGWARWAFILLLAPALAYGATRQSDVFVHPTTLFVLILSGAIVAMSFLPPARDMFAKQDLTRRCS